ncbi:S8/S53 family peptidase [Catellatospora bangladeshensis]|uniref:Peptidase S8/S53 domain-containing protein n=1 Tax=Catellatospora bangladeshensis TaxID=310355 RepID=A0A8J3JWH1_9ACTN|nr:S8/S53 family peptidase [Catellatospora bangladeshensis]GIF84354.1 hypothetical protein Cba03nite_57030 [Catellatospora bangladeshensis]
MYNSPAPRRGRWSPHTRLVAAAVTSLMAMTLAPAPAAATVPIRQAEAAGIGEGVRALRADLAKSAAAVGADVKALDELLAKAEAAGACEAAETLAGFSGDVGRVKLRAEDAARLARGGHRLRGQALSGLPDEEGCAGPVAVFVDPEQAIPAVRSLPGFERGTVRPVAGLLDSSGTRSSFVEDEVMVSTADKGRLDEFTKRWNGAVVHSFVPHAKDAVPQYLVRVDTGLGDPAKLGDHLAELNREQWKADSLAVSSDAGLRLLALAAQEAATDGNPLTVGVNWLDEPADYAGRTLAEAGFGPNGFNDNPAAAYQRDPYGWSYLDAGSVQDIGVTEAWTLLDSVGRLDNKVRVAVLDAGFSPTVNGDLPASTDMWSAVPFKGAGDPGSSASPWHGTIVASALAAVPGNFKGAAGPAGPVADLTLVYTGDDMFLIMAALSAAVADGSNLINMSMGKRAHWALAWTLLPLDGLTALLRATNDILIFASAGNDGANVDGTTCFLTCWEKYFYSPCENTGVICVGGLARNSLNRHGQSNYGSEHVDIYAPFELLVGANPQQSAPNKAFAAAGTSVASPYAVGVAALIWAARPDLSEDAVEDILMRNRRLSPDGKIKKKVINAFDAVRDALPASLMITTPVDGWVLSAVSPSQFRATVFADGNGTPTVTWRLANNTLLGTGNPIWATPPPGNHVITARATFPNGVTATDTVSVSVVNHTPVVTITNPTAASPAYGVSDPIPFHAISSDDAGTLPDSRLSWFLDNATVPFATGHNPTVVTGGGIGTHTVRLRGCDSFNVCAEDTVVITLAVDPPNQPPVVHITSPANGAVLWVNGSDASGPYHQLTLQATATDPEGFPLTTTWYDNGVPLATGLTPTVRLRGGCEVYGHTLTFVATDSAGNTRQDSIYVTVNILC